MSVFLLMSVSFTTPTYTLNTHNLISLVERTSLGLLCTLAKVLSQAAVQAMIEKAVAARLQQEMRAIQMPVPATFASPTSITPQTPQALEQLLRRSNLQVSIYFFVIVNIR